MDEPVDTVMIAAHASGLATAPRAHARVVVGRIRPQRHIGLKDVPGTAGPTPTETDEFIMPKP
ncbi:MAG: hypothetical protein ACRD0K_02205 [Egibacteraceae bacterium]